MSFRLSGLLLATLFFACGCVTSDTEQREILQALAVRSKALNSRDVTMYMTVVSAQYNDKGKNSVQLKENLEKNFRDFERISYEAETPSITVATAGAGSVCRYRMKIMVRGKEMTLNGTEHLRMVKESGKWKITAGI